MTVKDVIENAGHVLVVNPGLFERNVELLKNYGIELKQCKTLGKGAQVLGYLNLEEVLATNEEIGYDDEVRQDVGKMLNVIRARQITSNYNCGKEVGAQHMKGVV